MSEAFTTPVEWQVEFDTPGASEGTVYTVSIGHAYDRPPLIVKESTEPAIAFTADDLAPLAPGTYHYAASVRPPSGLTRTQSGPLVIVAPL
jgi:hypothetical protein